MTLLGIKMIMVARLNFLLILLVTLLSAINIQAADCGTIEAIQGSVRVLRDKQGVVDEQNFVVVSQLPFALRCVDTVVTSLNSTARLRLTESLIVLGANTRLQLSDVKGKSNERSLLNLYYGKIRSFFIRSTKNPQAGLQIKTPSAVTGVRGTDFYLSFEPNKRLTKQATIKGSVEVEQIGTQQKVVVNGGYQVDVASSTSLQVTKDTALQVDSLVVRPITPVVKEEIKQSSALAKTEDVFKSTEALKILGDSQGWSLKPDHDVPEDLKGIKNEF